MTIDFSIDDYKQLAEEIAAAGGELGGLLHEFVRMTFELTMDNTRAVRDKALEIADLRETCADLRERLESTSKVARSAESAAWMFRPIGPGRPMTDFLSPATREEILEDRAEAQALALMERI